MEDRILDSLNFVSEKEVKCTSIEEALDNLKPFLTTREPVDRSNITFGYNGSAQFTVAGIPHNTTRYAVQSLCKLAKVPDPFAKAIPLDLLQTNLGRLVPSIEKKIEVVKDIADNIIAFVPETYRPIKEIDLLMRLQDLFKENLADNIDITLDTRNLTMKFTLPKFTSVQPRKDDFIRAGLEITNSEVHDLDAQANLFLLRLVCTNGMTATTEWGVVKRNQNRRLSYEGMCSAFIHGIKGFRSNFDALKQLFEQMPNINLKSDTVTQTFTALRRIADKPTAAKMFSMDENEIKSLKEFEKDRKTFRAIGTENTVYGQSPMDTDANAYDTYNCITEYARDISVARESRIARGISGLYLTKLYKTLYGNKPKVTQNG